MPNERHHCVYMALISPIFVPDFIIFEMSLGPLWSLAVPLKFIRGADRCSRAYPNDVCSVVNVAPHACRGTCSPSMTLGHCTAVQGLPGHKCSCISFTIGFEECCLICPFPPD